MANQNALPKGTARHLAWQLRLTRGGLVAEAVARCFWPLWSVMLTILAFLMFGLQDLLPLEAMWGLAVASVLGAGAAVWSGLVKLRWPTARNASDRLDATLPGRPLAALADTQAIGSGNAASEAVWSAHQARMIERAADARAQKPDMRLSARDPYGLRYLALLAFTMALLFGSIWRVSSVTEIATGAGGSTIATGPAWEGWVEPPLYTGLPSLYLNDIDRQVFDAPAGSTVTIRFYGQIGDLTLSETVSGRTDGIPAATDPNQIFTVTQAGEVAIAGPGGQTWQIGVTPDLPPSIQFDGPIARGEGGRMEAPFTAIDDFGVTGGTVRIALQPARADRRHGLAIAAEQRAAIEFDLPLPISADRADFAETVIEDFSKHPFANLPVTISLNAEDATGQVGESEVIEATLPGRRFFDPLAKAIIEQRRDLLWNRENAARVAQVLRAVSYVPDDIFRAETNYLKLRFVLRRVESRVQLAALSDDFIDETAEALWALALDIEIGDLDDALERLRRAQDRLAEAIENGATDEEIAELMQELREAMQEYFQQLAEQAQEQGNQQAQNQQGEQQQITGDQLQDMMDRLQELMEQGRTAEAQQLLEQLRQMMENMQVAQGQQGQGQGQQSQGEQALEGLAETLRDQQGLSDEAFRDLQEQFNPGAEQGQSQGNEGRNGDQGRGQQHGQQGQGQDGQEPGQQQGQQSQGGQGQGSLADRQQALRDELSRQQNNLPGAGTPEGESARESLGRAGEAMDDAEDALRNDDFAGALDDQSRAIEELREGMRNLAEQLSQQQSQQGQPGQDGRQAGNPEGSRDPLGRETGQSGRLGSDEQLLGGEDVYGRARELLDELRKRSAEQERPGEELDYLRRLLDQF